MFKYTFPRFLQLFAPSCTWKVNTQDKVLYLTFDDGPHPDITAWVLDLLKQFNASATFFCVGENAMKYPDVVKRILHEGHGLGNHTYNHIKGWNSENQFYLDNIKKASEFVPSKLFRPPYGRIKPAQIRLLKNDFEIIMWSHLSRDYDPGLNRKESIQAMKKAGPGSIMVFHDSIKAFDNLKSILPPILLHFQQLGYQFKSLCRS